MNRRDRKLFPVALQRGPLYDSVMRAGQVLNDLRKNRPKKDPLLLPDYIKSKSKAVLLNTPSQEEGQPC